MVSGKLQVPFTTYYLPLTIYHLPLITYHLPLTTYHLPLTTYQVPLTTCNLPLTTYHLPLTAYHLLLTTPFFNFLFVYPPPPQKNPPLVIFFLSWKDINQSTPSFVLSLLHLLYWNLTYMEILKSLNNQFLLIGIFSIQTPINARGLILMSLLIIVLKGHHLSANLRQGEKICYDS